MTTVQCTTAVTSPAPDVILVLVILVGDGGSVVSGVMSGTLHTELTTVQSPESRAGRPSISVKYRFA